MSAEYAVIEAAVVSRLITVFSSELSVANCQASDLDGVVLSMFGTGSNYGCVVDFGGGRSLRREEFKGQIWAWRIFGLFLLRYTSTATIELAKRQVVQKLRTLFSTDHTLGGLVPLVEVSAIEPPTAETVNDVPMYWLGFTIDVVDK